MVESGFIQDKRTKPGRETVLWDKDFHTQRFSHTRGLCLSEEGGAAGHLAGGVELAEGDCLQCASQ